MKRILIVVLAVFFLAVLASSCGPMMPKENPKFKGVDVTQQPAAPAEPSAAPEAPPPEQPAPEQPAPGQPSTPPTPPPAPGGESGGE